MTNSFFPFTFHLLRARWLDSMPASTCLLLVGSCLSLSNSDFPIIDSHSSRRPHRCPCLIGHSVLTLVTQGSFGIALLSRASLLMKRSCRLSLRGRPRARRRPCEPIVLLLLGDNVGYSTRARRNADGCTSPQGLF